MGFVSLRGKRPFIAPVCMAALLLARATTVRAATFTVDTTADDVAKTACDDATADDCSLRGAIAAANGLTAPSTVHVPAGTFELTQLGTCTRQFPGGGSQPSDQVALCLTAHVTIQGAGPTATVIDGKGQHRVLFVSFDAVAEVRGVTLTNGLGEVPGGGIFGGAINNQGTLRLTDSVVSNSTLSATTGGAGGAGIYNGGALTLLRSTVTRNIARNAGGGGGIYNDGNAVLTVIDSVIRDDYFAGGWLVGQSDPLVAEKGWRACSGALRAESRATRRRANLSGRLPAPQPRPP
jgi:hypothetical protein